MGFGVGVGVDVGDGVGVGLGDGVSFGLRIGVATGLGDGLAAGVASGTNQSRSCVALCLVALGFENSAHTPQLASTSMMMINGSRSHFGSANEPQTANNSATRIIIG